MTISQPHLSHSKYRPDIDGLRAIAVLSVVAFHAFPSWIKGGFIGVDVFFVISGYLISTIIFENLDEGTFSFSEFYARRIRRIFPALLLILIASYAFGWFALLADEYKQLSKHIAAGAGFVSNIVLWNEAGYFDNSAETKPLLHLWSLGIEEQFYIVWPLLIWLSWKRGFNLLTITTLVSLISFYLNVKGVKDDAVATFYSPAIRFWELLCGSLLAWITLYKKESYQSVRLKVDAWLSSAIYRYKTESDGNILSNILSFTGLLLLAYGFWRINKNVSFPGKWAIIPVLGAVLIITAGSKTWINRIILSNRISVWFGLISFPLYLWHWPLLSFARIVESEVPSLNIRIAAVVLSIVLAWLTYKLVERPMRLGIHGKAKTAFLVVLMIAVGYVGFFTYLRNGFEFRLSNEINQKTDLLLTQTKNQAYTRCSQHFPEWTKITDNACGFQRETGNTIAIIGDSHAGHLFPGLSELMMPDEGVTVFAASCAAPFIDVSTATKDINARKVREEAYKLINRAYDYIINDSKLKYVVLAHNPLCSYFDAIDMKNPNNKDFHKVLEDGMRRTFSALVNADKNVIVLLDNPYLPYEPSQCINRPVRLTEKYDSCSFTRDQSDNVPAVTQYRSLVERVLKDYPQVRAYDLSTLFCDTERCYISKNNSLLYRDRGHLSQSGSRYVAPYLLNAIKMGN